MSHLLTPPCRAALATLSWHRPLLPLLLILALFAGTVAQPARAASNESRVLPQLQNAAAEQPDKEFRVIVTRINKDTNADRKVKAYGGRKIKDMTTDAFVAISAADPMGTTARGDDTIAPWSSYGTTQDGFAKPDVVAPGRYIVGLSAGPGSTLAKTFPDRVVDSYYIRMSGTSMAAPIVAGLAALAFQAHPEWTNDQVKWLLLNTSGTRMVMSLV